MNTSVSRLKCIQDIRPLSCELCLHASSAFILASALCLKKTTAHWHSTINKTSSSLTSCFIILRALVYRWSYYSLCPEVATTIIQRRLETLNRGGAWTATVGWRLKCQLINGYTAELVSSSGTSNGTKLNWWAPGLVDWFNKTTLWGDGNFLPGV